MGENDPRTADHPTIINGEESITIKNPPSSSGGRGVGGHTSIGQMLMHRRRCQIPRSALLRFVFISFFPRERGRYRQFLQARQTNLKNDVRQRLAWLFHPTVTMYQEC